MEITMTVLPPAGDAEGVRLVADEPLDREKYMVRIPHPQSDGSVRYEEGSLKQLGAGEHTHYDGELPHRGEFHLQNLSKSELKMLRSVEKVTITIAPAAN